MYLRIIHDMWEFVCFNLEKRLRIYDHKADVYFFNKSEKYTDRIKMHILMKTLFLNWQTKTLAYIFEFDVELILVDVN